MVEATTPR
jgi:hypothetical protein